MSKLETFKDSAESGLDSATTRVENIHRLISSYVRHQVPGLKRQNTEDDDDGTNVQAESVYDIIRGVNREIGEFGTDVFEIIEDARMRHEAENERKSDDG